ncbi:hypothetical protein RHGRI_012626 [Rhododendron griersonianum]|uniref:Uncharacterized protein n=1 Tax=Rhododendron griersonianum TaxID=479676 RepID=A0AAV6KRQ6_9ERIC|nr:hypothetical protein RHGRI_012626 [Rhododendron griersonianum]
MNCKKQTPRVAQSSSTSTLLVKEEMSNTPLRASSLYSPPGPTHHRHHRRNHLFTLSFPITGSNPHTSLHHLATTSNNPDRRRSAVMSSGDGLRPPFQLNDESDFDRIASPDDGLLSVCGFGSLLSERSARSTFPDLVDFRVARLNGFRRVFAHTAPIFFERGIANPETKEISSLSVEPCKGETLIVTVFNIRKSEIPSFIEREHEFRFLAVLPETLDGKPFASPACESKSDDYCLGCCCRKSYRELLLGNAEKFVSVICDVNLLVAACAVKRSISSDMDDITFTRFGAMISYLAVFIFGTAKSLGDAAYNNFLDHTFLGDRKTTIREYLATTGSGIMEEEPPELLKTRSIWDVKLLESALGSRSGEGLGGKLEDPNSVLAELFLLSFAPPSGRNVSFD